MNSTNGMNVIRKLDGTVLPQLPRIIANIAHTSKTPLNQDVIVNLTDTKELVLASLLLAINLPLLMMTFGRKALRKRKSHQLFINITIVHILSAVSIIASNFAKATDVQTYLIINNGLLIEMFEMLMVMSCERLMAIKYSFEYIEVRKRHIIALLVCTWVLPLLYVIMGTLYGFSVDASLIISTILINAATIILGITNLMIYRLARKHDNFLKENAKMSIKAMSNRNSLKASCMCFAIVASFMVLWTPYCIHDITSLSKLHDKRQLGDVFSQVVDFIGYLHGVVDPLFFICLSQTTKKEIRKMLKNLQRKLAKAFSDPA